jgi:predicted Zn-dependent peptidase
VRSITREDIVGFYNGYYLRGNIYAGIAGAVDDTIVDRFRTDIHRMPAGTVIRSDNLARNPRQRRVILVEKEGRTQTHLRIGHHLEVNRGDDDYYPLRVLGSYLGQHREMFGQLFRSVRSQRGLSYGAYAYVENFAQAGWSKLPRPGIPRNDQYFHMWTYPKEANFEFCIKMLTDEMSQLISESIEPEEADRIKAFLANHFAFEIETPASQLGMSLDEQWYDLPNYVETFRDRIEAVPRTELQSIALDHLHPQQPLIVAIVSDGAAAKSELLTRSTELELPSGATEGELKGENDRIKSIDLGLKADDITIVRAEDLFR